MKKRINRKLFAVIVVCLLTILTLLSYTDAKDHPVRIYFEQNPDGGYNFYADNNSVIPYTVKVWFTKLQGFTVSEEVPYFEVIPVKAKMQFLLSITPIPGEKTLFYYMFNYYKGDCLNAKHDDSHVYLIPYKHGTKFKLSQAYHGGFSHIGNLSYALDFMMPEGTEIYAARSGIVAEVKEDSDIGGLDMKYAKHGNYILIYHKDSSFAYYIHLKKNGSIVEVGDKVKAGDLIGYSGNTGRSGAPHLHFDVRIPQCGDEMKTIPTQFLNYDNKPITLKPATMYYATHPGKPKYKVVLGRNITIEDYNDYSKTVPADNKVNVRYDKIDDTYVFFAQNGLNKKIQVTLTFPTLKNMVSSRPQPVKLIIPPLTEKFMCFIRPRKLKNPSEYNMETLFYYNYNYEYVK